jgi:hypothetical protein
MSFSQRARKETGIPNLSDPIAPGINFGHS